MSNFAQIDANGIVIQVLVGDNSFPNEGYDWFVENLGGTWIQTSYNASVNGFRKNFAGKGMAYDSIRDAFIAPKPYLSWVLDEATCQWQSPTPMPADGAMYQWDEATLNWKATL
jgi:hypothetical protein